jgi:gallidermin/nisin family lantibiotic
MGENMKIDSNFNNLLVNLKTGANDKQPNDPFDLNISARQIRIGENEVPQITSRSLCTPGCPRGTYHSFCC